MTPEELATYGIHLVSRMVACQTEGCQNVNIPITIAVDRDDPQVVCGACMQSIDPSFTPPAQAETD